MILSAAQPTWPVDSWRTVGGFAARTRSVRRSWPYVPFLPDGDQLK